jgi:hypothetical protein
MFQMMESFREHHPDVKAHSAVYPPAGRSWQELSNFKVEWLCKVRVMYPWKSILWVDADARFRRPIVTPDGDIGAKCYASPTPTPTARISTGTLWISPAVTLDFLETWRDMPHGPIPSNEFTLSQTMALYPHLRYVELPDELTSVCNLSGWDGMLEHDSAIVHWNRSRKELGHVDDWPPSEDVRRSV